MSAWSPAVVAKKIDHTLLKPEASAVAIVDLCREGAELGVAAVCVSANRVALAVAELERLSCTTVAVASVVGFPSGAHLGAVTSLEAARAVADGASEIDMVMDLGAALDRDWETVERGIRQVRLAIPGAAVLKVILETAALSPAIIVQGCRTAESAGADYVKTSTGFHPAGGASLEAVRLMVETVGGRLGVKASGGIRTAAAALEYLDAGATRLGLSASRAVLDGLAS